MGFGGVLGQLIGGLLIRADIAGLGWRAVFLINVPVGLVAVPAAYRIVPESRAANGARLDVLGTLLVSTGLVLIVLPLVEGHQQGWPRHAASAAGVISTSLQAGGAIGIAVIGVIFYGVLGTGHFTAAFGVSLAVMAAFCAASAGLVQLLPRR